VSELKDLLSEFSGELKAHVDEQVKGSKQDLTNLILSKHEETRSHLARHEELVGHLWQRVNGSNPPPPGEPPSAPSSPPLDDMATGAFAKASSHDLDIFAMRREVQELKTALSSVLEINKEQSKALGVGVDVKRSAEFLDWIMTTKAGQRWVLTVFAALTSLITAVGTTYALITGRLPLP
jgi:hypothetical protein